MHQHQGHRWVNTPLLFGCGTVYIIYRLDVDLGIVKVSSLQEHLAVVVLVFLTSARRALISLGSHPHIDGSGQHSIFNPNGCQVGFLLSVLVIIVVSSWLKRSVVN